MKRVIFCGMLLVLLSACASGTYNVPKREYQSRVQVLGVVPLLVDSRPLNYPESAAVYAMLRRSAQETHLQLAEQIRSKRGYFDVRPLQINADLVGLSLLAGGGTHDETGRPLGYRLDRATVAELARQNVVDALLVVVLSGEQVEETRRSRTRLESLRTTFSGIYATAVVVDREGEVLWAMAGSESYPAVPLQYPDFDEAYYNRAAAVAVKNISLKGAERIIAGEQSLDAPELSKMYIEMFGAIASGISPRLFGSLP
ncbi:MAG: hypothetical protein R6W66_06840 [Pelovirga sp.]